MESFPPSANYTEHAQQTSHKKSAKGGPGPLLIPPHYSGDRDTEQGAPENQLSPTFNAETSTTDSGVSNASSLTSDCATHEALPTSSHALVTPTVGSFETLVLPDNETHCLSLDVCNTEDTASTSCFKEGCPDRGDGKREDRCLRTCVGNMTGTDSSLHSNITNSGPTTGGTPSETSGSRCSSSLDRLEPPPPSSSSTHHPDLSPQDIQKRLLEGMQTLSTADSSHETESTDSLVLSSQRPRQRSASPVHTRPRTFSLRSVFKRKRLSYVGSADPTSQHLLAANSTTGLILENRPKELPAKSAAEAKRHQKLHEQIVAAARKKELQRAKEEVRKEQQRRQKDKTVGESLKEWGRILPNWETLHHTRKVQELWWKGLPPGVRGEVWKKAIGNELNISPNLYQICLNRCKERLASVQMKTRSDSNASQKSVSREHSVEVIHLDVLRTFPTLGFFQEGGPYNESLHDVLGAYACYRPDIGYVQGMSFLAAVLLLNLEASDAFICLANLLNRPSYLAFFKVDHTLMQPYFDTFNILLQDSLPKLSTHFKQLEFSPEYYLIEWVFTIYTKVLPLDTACRVWDLFCRDGDSFLFRTALAANPDLLRLQFLTLQAIKTGSYEGLGTRFKLLEFHSIEEVGQFLGTLPSSLDAETLFSHISSINLTSKHFSQVLQLQLPLR